MRSIDRARGLDWLINPEVPELFFEGYWQRLPLFVRRGSTGYYSGLPGLADVDSLITSTVFGASSRTLEGRMVRTDADGQLIQTAFRLDESGLPDIHHVFRSYEEGNTVVLNGLQRRSREVAALCAALESDFDCPVGANLYLTPKGAQGFRCHTDSHDVFILQVHGEKHWSVGTSAAFSFPTVAVPGPPVEALTDARSYLLSPGDVLYIPRGFAHQAATNHLSSLHLTVGIHPYVWADIAVEAVRLAAAEDAELRRALPSDHYARGDDTGSMISAVDRMARLFTPAILERARAALATRMLRRQHVMAGHFASLDGITDLSLETMLERGFSGSCRIRSYGSGLVVEYPGNFLSVPAFLAPALEYAARSDGAFSVSSIPGDLSGTDRIDFSGRLIAEGFLRIVTPTKEMRSWH